MQRLILFRHGAAQARALSGVDVDRALTPTGRTAALAAAAALDAFGATPDVALVSPALRARQTFEAARAVWPGVEMREAPEVYEAAADDLLAAARDARAASVLLVGHNPGLAQLGLVLASGPRTLQEFPPASTAVFERAAAGWSLAFWRPGDAR